MGKVVIFGAGRVGTALLKLLEERKHKITVVEENKELCDELAEESSAMVIRGDATDPNLLDELKLNEMDYVFAVTGNEETNFLASAYAKHAGATRVISRVTSAKHSKLLERLGVESVVSEFTLAAELANRVSSPIIHRLLNPLESKIELIEKEVDRWSKGKTVAELDKDKNLTVAALFKENHFIIPNPDVVLEEGMKIVLIRKR